MEAIRLGALEISPILRDGYLHSIGGVQAGGTALRSPAARWLPWFDQYEGGLFNRFRFVEQSSRGDEVVLVTKAIRDNDYPFRERRDSSGDLCFRSLPWDETPLEADLRIVFKPREETIDGRAFAGFQYWFEYECADAPIHRLLDRATWELGGDLSDLTVVCRNWLTPPRMKVSRDSAYSTVGLDKWANLLPGNMWGRWTLLPGFDLQYGKAGILAAWYDAVSLIRTVIESNPGEDAVRHLDFHWFEQNGTVKTNPKTVTYCPDVIDDTDALNLWTRLQDRDHDMACACLGIPEEEPPAVTFTTNQWRGFRFDSTYEDMLEVGAEFGAEVAFIDVIWEHGQALKETLDELVPPEKQKGTVLEKITPANMCCTLDLKVADVHGGEAGLKALCDRARAKDIRIISWMATHFHPHSALDQNKELGHGKFGIYASQESGRHPSTGYASHCWTANLNAPIYEYIRDSILGVCERTGLSGFLWDSFCNLGWWQVDYPDGSMRPQFDKMGAMYADFIKAGLYLQPEAVVSFSNHSCCGLHGGNVYEGDLLGYSYNTVIALWFGRGNDHKDTLGNDMLRGQAPTSDLFRCVAHKRVPNLQFHQIPREEWDADSVAELKEILAAYKACRPTMKQRTVLKDDAGVLWEGAGDEAVLFSFKEQPCEGEARDAVTGETVSALKPYRAYRIDKATVPVA